MYISYLSLLSSSVSIYIKISHLYNQKSPEIIVIIFQQQKGKGWGWGKCGKIIKITAAAEKSYLSHHV